MPNKTIHAKLNALKVDNNIKKNINALEGFITKHESSILSNLLIPHQEEYINFSLVLKPFMALDKVFFDTIANGISRNNLVTKITKLKEDIRKNYAFLNKEHNCFTELDNAKKSLEEEVKKKSDDQNESKIGEAENILKKYTILVLEEQIKENNKNFEAAIKFYDVNSNNPLCLARYMWLKDQSKQSIPDLEHAELSVHLIKETINNQAKADNTGSSLPVEGDITLLDLGRIKDWNNFKFSFGKRLNELRSKKNETEALVNETPNALLEKNSQLLNEVSELKKKIISLERQLFDANSNIEENKLTENNDKEPTNSNIVTSDSLQNQNDEKITDLNNQLSQLTETNKTLTEEIDTNKELNVKQKQTILNLNSELENLKTELEIKEKQITENLEKLKQHEEQLISQENALLKNTQALEKSTKENETLSEALTASSKTLAEKNQSLIKTESELNELKGAHNRIKLEIEGLNHKLAQNTRYNDGIFEQKQEEIAQLNTELKQLNEQLITAKADFSSNSTANDHKTLLLETKIEEKNSILAGLKNKLAGSEEKTNQLKKEAAELKRQLDAKSLKLQDNESQLKTLTEQFTNLSNQKNTLEKKYEAQIAEYEALKTQHTSNITDLEDKLITLQKETALADNEKIGLKENVDSLETNLQEEKSKFSASKQKISELQNELYTLRSNLTSTEQDLKFKLNQTREEKKAISEKLETVTKERESFISKAYDVLPNFISSDSKDYFTLVPTDSNKESEGILQKIDLLKKQKEENEEKIEELQNQLEMLKIESDKKDAKIFELKLPNIDLDDENTKTLIQEKDHLQERVAFLTKKLIELEQQNKNLAQDPTPPARFSLDFEFENEDFQGDPITDTYDSDNEDEADHYQSFAATQEKLVLTKALLNKTQTELQQKIDEINQLKDHLKSQETLQVEMDALKRSFEEAAETLSVLKSEKGKLNKDLKDAQEALQTSKSEINNLQDELGKLQKNDSSNQEAISKLTNQIQDLKAFDLQKEESIEDLTKKIVINSSLIEEKENQIESLNKTLAETQGKSGQLENRNGQLEEQTIKMRQNIDQLTNGAIALSSQIEELTIEKENLNQKLKDAQEALQTSKSEINNLQVEIEKQQTNKSTDKDKISELTQKIKLFEELKGSQENSIKGLTNQIQVKDNEIRSLTTDISKLIEQKNTAIKELEGKLDKKLKQIDSLEKSEQTLTTEIEKLVVENESLNQSASDAKEALDNANLEITKLEGKLANLRTDDSSKQEEISELTNLLDELNKLKSQQEKLISELQSQLISKNAELKGLFDQHSVNDKLITNLKNTISIYKNELTVAKEAIATLNEKLETKQKDDSNLKVDHAKLGTELSEKILELNKIQTELKSTKEQLEEARAKNITQGGLTMPGTQTDLIDFENPMPNQDHPDQVNPKANFPDENGSSSGNSSRHSSSNSHTSSENINSHLNPLFSHNENPRNENTLPINLSDSVSSLSDSVSSLSDDEDEQDRVVSRITPTNTGTPMPTQEQQSAQVDNTSSIHERGVINAFNEEHHEAIRLAFTAEFARLATVAATTLFNGNIVTNSDLPTFKNELDEKANEEIQRLISALSNKKELLSGIIEKIHTQGLTATTYLEEVKNSASDIFETLKIKRQGEADQTYKDYIKDISENLLINLCTENLQTEEKTNLLQIAKQKLESKITTNSLQSIEQHTETIKIAAEELVTNILKADKLKSIIEDAKNDPTAGVNLLEASKQKLQEQLEQEVDQTFEYYFPIVHLNPIFQKIKDGEELTEEEIQKIPSELQYADSIKDFVSGLRVKYSHLSSDYEGKIDDNNFKNLRLILRKKALADTNQVIPKDNEIIDLDAKAWLEKKLQLITGKSVNLALVKLEKEQENLLNELSSSLHISTFYDIAITRKTIPELTQEIEKANKAQSSTAEQISQIYKEIESKQTAYPKLIDDEAIAGFRANLNQHLENSSIALEVNNKQTETLLMGINQRLKKDISKWGFLDNKLQKEITNDIANTNGFPFDETATEKLVQHAMLVLRDNYPNETIEKRKQWLKDIALLHAITKKLATFSPKIKENIAKFEDLRVRKEEDVNQLEEPVANKIADAVYLPHRHTIIANSLDPNLAKRLPADFELLVGAFYKQDPLQIGQTLTFALSLHNGEEQKCSVTRDETCLAYKIHTPWLNIVNKIKDGVANKMTYARSNTNSSKQFNTEEETLFTLLTHAVNSSKGPTHTIMLGKNCSNEKERFIRLFVEKFNAEQKLSSKKTILLANANGKLKIHLDDKKTIYNKIHKANSLTEEFDNATTQTIDTLNRHITRPRG